MRPDRTATLECGDGTGQTVWAKPIRYTGFPPVQLELYFSNNTILLPGEY